VQTRVNSLRNHNGIAAFNPERDGSQAITIAAAAKLLGVSTATVRKLVQSGLLCAHQPVPYAPWAISPEQLASEKVKAAVEVVRLRQKLPRSVPAGQLNLINTAT
jgi:hypothetical protein